MPQEPTRVNQSLRRIITYGLGSCLTYSVITWLSFQFVYGQGHQQRPLLSFLGCYGAAFLFYCLALREVRRGQQMNPINLRVIISFTLGFRAIVLWSQPIQEDDFYRYLWDGKVVASGLNPYAVSPQRVKEARADDVLIRPYVRIGQQEPEFARILARVNYPTVPTIYPPLAQGLFAVTALVAPGSFIFVYRRQDELFRWVIWLEYVPFYSLLVWDWLKTQRNSRIA